MVRRPCGFALFFILLLVPEAFPAKAVAPAASQQLLIASDIHFNPFADTSLVADLAAAPVPQWEIILNRSKPSSFSPYGQDTNWWLLQSSLDAMRSTLPHPALVMVTGDLLAHGFPSAYANALHDGDREHYRAFVRKTIDFLAWELRKRFEKEQILLTPGNNDDECGDYDIEAEGPFLSDTADVARKLARAGADFSAQWKALGSYTLQPRAIHSVRIISVNSVFFSNKYQAANFAGGCSQVDSTAAARTLDWLQSSLADADRDQQKVWLMFHIPPGIDGFSTLVQTLHLAAAPGPAVCSQAIVPMWKPVWTARFDDLLQQYRETVLASFAGHDHTDDFRVIHATQANQEFVLIDPPISPIYGQNPAFRVVDFRSDGTLADQTTYYLTNLQTAGSGTSGKWAKEYSFNEAWHTQQLDASSLKSIYDRIRSDPDARAQWLRLLNVSSAHDPVPVGFVGALDCAIGALDPADYAACFCPAATTSPEKPTP